MRHKVPENNYMESKISERYSNSTERKNPGNEMRRIIITRTVISWEINMCGTQICDTIDSSVINYKLN